MNFFGIGLPEMLVIFTVALLVFGPRKLPEISRTIAKTVKGLQQASRDFEQEMSREINAIETRPTPPPVPATLSPSPSGVTPPGDPPLAQEPLITPETPEESRSPGVASNPEELPNLNREGDPEPEIVSSEVSSHPESAHPEMSDSAVAVLVDPP